MAFYSIHDPCPLGFPEKLGSLQFWQVLSLRLELCSQGKRGLSLNGYSTDPCTMAQIIVAVPCEISATSGTAI